MNSLTVLSPQREMKLFLSLLAIFTSPINGQYRECHTVEIPRATGYCAGSTPASSSFCHANQESAAELATEIISVVSSSNLTDCEPWLVDLCSRVGGAPRFLDQCACCGLRFVKDWGTCDGIEDCRYTRVTQRICNKNCPIWFRALCDPVDSVIKFFFLAFFQINLSHQRFSFFTTTQKLAHAACRGVMNPVKISYLDEVETVLFEQEAGKIFASRFDRRCQVTLDSNVSRSFCKKHFHICPKSLCN